MMGDLSKMEENTREVYMPKKRTKKSGLSWQP
jgi:hypothetical protein